MFSEEFPCKLARKGRIDKNTSPVVILIQPFDAFFPIKAGMYTYIHVMLKQSVRFNPVSTLQSWTPEAASTCAEDKTEKISTVFSLLEK